MTLGPPVIQGHPHISFSQLNPSAKSLLPHEVTCPQAPGPGWGYRWEQYPANHTPNGTGCQGIHLCPFVGTLSPSAINTPVSQLTFTLPPPHQHRLHRPHVHILPRQPLEAGHQGQPIGLGAAGSAPAACPGPVGALAPGATRAAGRVTLIAPAVISLLEPPGPILLV